MGPRTSGWVRSAPLFATNSMVATTWAGERAGGASRGRGSCSEPWLFQPSADRRDVLFVFYCVIAHRR
eukprot:8276061-Alexandrium_andersonii.AAC.1